MRSALARAATVAAVVVVLSVLGGSLAQGGLCRSASSQPLVVALAWIVPAAIGLGLGFWRRWGAAPVLLGAAAGLGLAFLLWAYAIFGYCG